MMDKSFFMRFMTQLIDLEAFFLSIDDNMISNDLRFLVIAAKVLIKLFRSDSLKLMKVS